MKDKLKVVLCVLATALLLFSVIYKSNYNSNDNNDDLENTDALTFKEEYEALNDSYLKLEISSDNPIKYSTIDEIVDRVNNGTGVIYLGYASDSLCRSIIPILLQASDDAGLENIYYCDIEEDSDYQELLEILNEYDSELFEDIIDVPCLIFVYEGEIVGIHVGSVDSYNLEQGELDDEQFEELYNIYTDYIHVVLNDLCDEKC